MVNATMYSNDFWRVEKVTHLASVTYLTGTWGRVHEAAKYPGG
jgi:hypothetical protein